MDSDVASTLGMVEGMLEDMPADAKQLASIEDDGVVRAIESYDKSCRVITVYVCIVHGLGLCRGLEVVNGICLYPRHVAR